MLNDRHVESIYVEEHIIPWRITNFPVKVDGFSAWRGSAKCSFPKLCFLPLCCVYHIIHAIMFLLTPFECWTSTTASSYWFCLVYLSSTQPLLLYFCFLVFNDPWNERFPLRIALPAFEVPTLPSTVEWRYDRASFRPYVPYHRHWFCVTSATKMEMASPLVPADLAALATLEWCFCW
jgi:hypothetical protein